MKGPSKKGPIASIAVVVVLAIFAIVSYRKARSAADTLVGVKPGYTKSWFQPMYRGGLSPRWGFTYWAGGETGGMIAEVHISLFGQVRYRKGHRVSGSPIHGIDS